MASARPETAKSTASQPDAQTRALPSSVWFAPRERSRLDQARERHGGGRGEKVTREKEKKKKKGNFMKSENQSVSRVLCCAHSK